jgi:hypothetical protein
MDRVIHIPRTTAKTVMTAFAQDITPDFGFDHMKMMARVKDPEIRRDMDLKRREGYSSEMLRQELKGEPLPEILPAPMGDPVEIKISILETHAAKLEKELARVQKQIEVLRGEGLKASAHRQLDCGF